MVTTLEEGGVLERHPLNANMVRFKKGKEL